MTDRPTRSLRRPLLVALKLVAVGAALVLVAAVSAWLTVRQAVSGRDVLVPELTGMTGAEAEVVLRKQGLSLEKVLERYDPGVQAGHILAQEPTPGSSIKVDRKVKVVVSLGQKGSAVPELRGGAARTAQIALQQQGFRMGDLVYAYSPKEEENLIIGQDPLPGQATGRDAQVSLLVSRGRRPVTYVMPSLIGRPRDECLRWLARAGLRPAPARRDAGSSAVTGTVVAQHPEAGWPVRTGDLVILTVAGEENKDE